MTLNEELMTETFATTSACVEWVADKLLQVKDAMTKRLRPYAAGKRLYEEMVMQPVKTEVSLK